MVYPLDRDRFSMGGVDRAFGAPRGQAIVLSEGYAAVTRVSRPHARITRHRDGVWFIEDCGSTGGTFVNGRLLEEGRRHELHDGDMIDLAKGASGATLVFVAPVEGYGAG